MFVAWPYYIPIVWLFVKYGQIWYDCGMSDPQTHTDMAAPAANIVPFPTIAIDGGAAAGGPLPAVRWESENPVEFWPTDILAIPDGIAIKLLRSPISGAHPVVVKFRVGILPNGAGLRDPNNSKWAEISIVYDTMTGTITPVGV